MERKLVKQGRNALTVTLPAKWLKRKNLNAGDVINISEKDNDLLISSEQNPEMKEITLDLRDYERSLILHIIMGKYIKGYDRIRIIHNSPKVFEEQKRFLLGMIIEKHCPTKTVYKSIIQKPDDNFKTIMKRTVFILLEQARTLESVSIGKATVNDVKIQERLLDQNINYCLRYLNKYETDEDEYKNFLLCSTIETAADQLSKIAEHIGKNKVLARKIVNGIEGYEKYLFSNDFKKLYLSLRQFRNSIERNTFVDGLAFTLAEDLYNYIGFQIEAKVVSNQI